MALETPMGISVKGVAKRFDRFAALDHVDLEVAPGELVALLGPSGSGKTTLLRVLAGLERADAGAVRFDGEDVTHASTGARRIGFVFQHYALFRHMTVAQNIAFGLDVKRGRGRPSRAARRERVAELLKLVELEGLDRRRPAQLSGGQRQRVALARALAVGPRALLLDEPFGALDAAVRKSLRRELRGILAAAGLTTVFVTHDQEEALELADRIAVMAEGRVRQVGTPRELLDAPADAFVAGFVGEASRIEGEVQGGAFRSWGLTLPAPHLPDGPALAFVRPHGLALAAPGEPALDAHVVRAAPTVDGWRLELRGPRGEAWEARATRDIQPPTVGAAVRVAVREASLFSATPRVDDRVEGAR